MNCSDAETLIFTARDTELGAADAASLEQHLAECPRCRRVADDLAAASRAWQQRDAAVPVPDSLAEWHAVRRRIRNADTASPASGPLTAWPRLLRFAVPLAAAAAVAIGLTTRMAPPAAIPAEPQIAAIDWSEYEEHFAHAARAEYVETDDEDVSPFVYLDEQSGWLIVWASDSPETPSI